MPSQCPTVWKRLFGACYFCLLALPVSHIAHAEPAPNPPQTTAGYVVANDMGRTYHDAVNWCQTHDLQLVEIESATENQRVVNEINRVSTPEIKDVKQFWLGANDLDNEGVFVWPKQNTQLWPNKNKLYDNWGTSRLGSQPNNVQKKYEDEDCVVIRPDGKWYDIGCQHRLAFAVCETASTPKAKPAD